MITTVNTSPFHLSVLRKTNTWFSVCDGNWNNANTWMSNGLDRKRHLSPQPGDNVYINHNVTLDGNYTVNNIYGNGDLIFGTTAVIFTINNALNMSGTIDMSNAAHQLILNGYINYIGTFIGGTQGTVLYSSTLVSQPIMAIAYQNLTIRTANFLVADTAISGNLVLNNNSSLELDTYNFTVGGNATFSSGSVIRTPASTGKLFKIIGQFNSNFGNLTGINLGTTNDMELQGGMVPNINKITCRTLILSATQSWGIGSGSLTLTLNCNIQINSGVTVTANNEGFIVLLTGIINGIDSTSVYNNFACLNLNTLQTPMTTGVLTMQTSASIGYLFNGDYTIPYTTLNNLMLAGTGIKALSGHTTINGNIKMALNSGTLELSTFNLTITGTLNNLITSANNLFSTAIIQRTPSSTGALLKFVGLCSNNNNGFTINLGTTNDVEFQGGLVMTINSWTARNINFTATQSINDNSSFQTTTLNANMVLANDVVVTANHGLIITGTLNGSNSGSTFINKSAVTYKNATAPMATGKLYCNQGTNTFIYGLAGNQDITVPADPTPGYVNLILNNSGAKRLLGNVSVKGAYTLTTPATLNPNGFALTNP